MIFSYFKLSKTECTEEMQVLLTDLQSFIQLVEFFTVIINDAVKSLPVEIKVEES